MSFLIAYNGLQVWFDFNGLINEIMKDVNGIYKEWCGNDKYENDCHPVHDSTETIEFAEYYAEHLKLKNLTIPVVSKLLIDFWRELPKMKEKYLLPEEQNNMVRDFLKSNL